MTNGISHSSLTPKQEAFAKHYAANGNAYDAYRHAYPTSESWTRGAVDVEASRMLDHPKISLRIQELQHDIATATGISTEWVVARLTEQATIATEDASHAARVRALELLGKHIGMWQAREQSQDSRHLHIHTEISGMSRDELRALIAATGGHVPELPPHDTGTEGQASIGALEQG